MKSTASPSCFRPTFHISLPLNLHFLIKVDGRHGWVHGRKGRWDKSSVLFIDLLSFCYPCLVIQNVYSTLRELDYVVKSASDTLECRIERILKDMSNTALIILPEDEPIDVTSFLEQIEKLSISTASKLSQ